MAKKNLLATLADENYLDAAKQVFSGAYFNAGWKGDYMLLAYKVPKEKLEWFRKKGIIVKECEPPLDEKTFGKLSSLVLIKLYLFKPEFKNWEKIIFVDADTIIRYSLDDLMKVKGFAAVDGVHTFKVLFPKEKSTRFNEVYKVFKKKYDLKYPAFSVGLFVFDTSIIKEDTFIKLFKILSFYRFYIPSADDFILNLFFYKNWERLPLYYNVFVIEFVRFLYKFHLMKIKGVVIHFPDGGVFDTNKPWNKTHQFYKEWRLNLDKSNFIDTKKPYPNFKTFDNSEKTYWHNYYAKLYSFWPIIPVYNYLFVKPISLVNRLIGIIGIFLKINYPRTYYKLKKIKNENINN